MRGLFELNGAASVVAAVELLLHDLHAVAMRDEGAIFEEDGEIQHLALVSTADANVGECALSAREQLTRRLGVGDVIEDTDRVLREPLGGLFELLFPDLLFQLDLVANRLGHEPCAQR